MSFCSVNACCMAVPAPSPIRRESVLVFVSSPSPPQVIIRIGIIRHGSSSCSLLFVLVIAYRSASALCTIEGLDRLPVHSDFTRVSIPFFKRFGGHQPHAVQ
jgi:hypothetical protein